MKNRQLYNRLINNISKSIYKSINENYFSISNIQKNSSVANNTIIKIKDNIINKLLNGEPVTEDEVKLVHNYYIVNSTVDLLDIYSNMCVNYGYKFDFNWVNTSNITDMSELFSFTKLEANISQWDVSNVKNMSFMFNNAEFHGDISNWNTSKVKNMKGMFKNAQFNGNINNWDVSNVVNMSKMFLSSTFNRPLNNWNIDNVKDMSGMFMHSWFNQDISSWNTSNVIDMHYMFYNSIFDGNINPWIHNKDCDIYGMFTDSPIDKDENMQLLTKWNLSETEFNNMWKYDERLSNY